MAFNFAKLDEDARRAAFSHMSGKSKATKAVKKAAKAKPKRKAADVMKAAHQGTPHVSASYLRTGRASQADVDSLVKAYTQMHGKAPSAAQLARIKRAK